MPVHLDISALHFPGNRWKQCIKAPRGNPGHPGIAEARPGSGGRVGGGEQVGICSVPLIARRAHRPRGELGFLRKCVRALVCECLCVFKSVYSTRVSRRAASRGGEEDLHVH